MTDEERAWAVSEANWAGEGMFTKEELEQEKDRELANCVLHGWISYVNSQMG